MDHPVTSSNLYQDCNMILGHTQVFRDKHDSDAIGILILKSNYLHPLDVVLGMPEASTNHHSRFVYIDPHFCLIKSRRSCQR